MNILDHNTKLYKILSVVAFPFFWQPVLYLFLTTSRGYSSIQSLSLISLYSLSVVLLEVPGGAVADHISRKYSAAYGYLLKGIGFILLSFVTHYSLSILSMLIVGLGEALTSGSIESLMYETIEKYSTPKSKTFKKLFARTRTTLHISLAIYIAMGGIIGNYNLILPLRLSFAAYMIAAYISTRFIEETKPHVDKKYYSHIFDSFQYIFSKGGWSKGLVQIMLADFFFLGLISSMFWLTTPLLNDLGYSVIVVGLATALMRILKSIGAYIVSKHDDENDLRSMLGTGLVIVVIFFIGSIFYNKFLVLALMSILYFIQPAYQANDIQLLNEKIDGVDRTTLNSFQSMFTRAYEFLMLPIIGFFLDTGLSSTAFLFISTILLIGLGILFFSRRKISPEFYSTVPSEA